MRKVISCCISVLMSAILMLGYPLALQAMENTTDGTMPPSYYETEEFFSWLRSETDLVAFFETDRKIDGAFADAYAGRLRELFEQGRTSFISTLAGCSVDARYRASRLLSCGYIGRQEIQSFYDDILISMQDDTWSEQEMEVLQNIKDGAKQILDTYLPNPTTEPPSTTSSTEAAVPEETTLPLQDSGEETTSGLYWGVGTAVLAMVLIAGIYAFIKARKRA